MSRSLDEPNPTPGLLFIAACAGIGLGATNEVIEFIAVLSMPETNVGGYERTMGAFGEAMREGYRFYSYGDAMLVG